MNRLLAAGIAAGVFACDDTAPTTTTTTDDSTSPVSTVRARSEYQAIDLGTLGAWARPRALNNAQQVVGRGSETQFGQFPWLWEDGVMTKLPIPCCTSNTGADVINEHGIIAGTIAEQNTWNLARWDGSGFQLAPVGEPVFAEAVAITDGDVVLGRFGSADTVVGVVWSGTLQTLPHLSATHYTEPEDINEDEIVVGRSVAFYGEPEDPDTPGDFSIGAAYFHPVLWRNGVIEDLGVFGKVSDCRRSSPCAKGAAYDINNRGDVVGFSEDNNFVRRPLLWRNGTMTDLGAFAGQHAIARVINESGMVAGDGPSGMFVWENGRARGVGSLGGTYTEVTAINNRGDVAGTGLTASGEQHAFVWSRGEFIDFGFGLPDGMGAKAIDINARGDVLVVVANPCFVQDDGTCMFDINRPMRAVLFRRGGSN